MIDFNSADHCAGSIVGQFEGEKNDHCQTQYGSAGDSNQLLPVFHSAFNAVIQPSNETQHGVAFYGEEICETLVALGNVKTCLGLGVAKGFKIIDIAANSLPWDAFNLEPTRYVNSPNATETYKSGDVLTETALQPTMNAGTLTGSGTQGTMTGTVTAPAGGPATAPTGGTTSAMAPSSTHTLSPYKNKRAANARPAPAPEPASIDHVLGGGRIEHGAVRRTNTGFHKYQQVAKRAWRGVPLDQWDDKIHKRSETDWSVPSVRRRSSKSKRGPGFSSKPLSTLENRAIPPTLCNLIRTCMVDSVDDGLFNINMAGTSLIDAVRKLNTANDKDWTFLNNPLIVEVQGESGECVGYAFAWTKNHNLVANTCSDFGTERDVLEAALAQGVDGTTVSDMRLDLKLLSDTSLGAGLTDVLWVAARSVENVDHGINPLCAAIEVNW